MMKASLTGMIMNLIANMVEPAGIHCLHPCIEFDIIWRDLILARTVKNIVNGKIIEIIVSEKNQSFKKVKGSRNSQMNGSPA